MKGYEQIITAAEKRNAFLLPSHSSLHISKIGEPYWQPVTEMASRGDRAGVEFLLAHGASRNHAAYGAVFFDDDEWVTELWRKGAKPSMIAYAAIMSGSIDNIKQLLLYSAEYVVENGHEVMVYTTDWCTANLNTYYLAEAIARQGDRRALHELGLDRSCYRDSIARGVGMREDRHWARELISGAPALVNCLAHAAAEHNKIEFTEHLYQNHKASIHVIVGAAAQAGNKEWTHALLSRGASKEDAVYGAAKWGNLLWVKELVGGDDKLIPSATHGAIEGNHFYHNEALIMWLSVIPNNQEQIDLWIHSIQFLAPGLIQNCLPGQLDGARKNAVLMSPKQLRFPFSFHESQLLTGENREQGALFLLFS